MAKLFEYQGKSLLEKSGIPIPRGKVVRSAEEARRAALDLGGQVVLKAQAWVTSRAGHGGVRFADSPEAAFETAGRMLGMDLKGFKVEELLVEEKLAIEREFFLGLTIDDVSQTPALIFSARGGSGIEEIAREHPDQVTRRNIDPLKGFKPFDAVNILRSVGIRGGLQKKLSPVISGFFAACARAEARSAEINPLVLVEGGRVMAADCHMVIDDYAVFRHPELGIDIAREFDRPATLLEKAAYQVEARDHRGTFYFLQMERDIKPRTGVIGFHGAGGGGSMMSMDSLLENGFKIANYCDTSGNPSAAKVYRAAKIILSQKNIDGYFASGSGVASQEQFHSARGLVKAFRELRIALPAVIRIGGNAEEEAIEILGKYAKDLPARIEAYGRDTSAAFCAERLKKMTGGWDYAQNNEVAEAVDSGWNPAYEFETMTGKIGIDHSRCRECRDRVCFQACRAGILESDREGLPRLGIDPEEARKGKCTECLACELECEFHGNKGLRIDLPIPGLDEALAE